MNGLFTHVNCGLSSILVCSIVNQDQDNCVYGEGASVFPSKQYLQLETVPGGVLLGLLGKPKDSFRLGNNAGKNANLLRVHQGAYPNEALNEELRIAHV